MGGNYHPWSSYNLAREALISNLHSNEEFLSIFAHANQIALRTHETEKREHLKNLRWNPLVRLNPTYDLKHSFIQLCDRLTLSHNGS